jgi:hypothetical protein
MWFLLDALVIWRDRPYSLTTMRVFMLGWNTIAIASMPWVWSNGSFVN